MLEQTYDCVVIGGGPAGLSAAIYLARYHRSVLVADDAEGRSTTHEINENYLGFPDGIAARELRRLGRRQAQRFGACFAPLTVDEVRREDGAFVARGVGGELTARSLIIATGVVDRLPDFENADARDYFGASLFWCITCDGHKTVGARTGIVGATDEAATTCMQFLAFTDRLTMLTNRPPGAAEIGEAKREALARHGIPLVEGRVEAIEGDGRMMRAVTIEGGRRVELDFLFNQQGAVPNSDLARQLGVACDEAGYVHADNEQRTNVPMVFAAGDVTKAFAHQVVTAAHEGATAACTANYELYAPDQRE